MYHQDGYLRTKCMKCGLDVAVVRSMGEAYVSRHLKPGDARILDQQKGFCPGSLVPFAGNTRVDTMK